MLNGHIAALNDAVITTAYRNAPVPYAMARRHQTAAGGSDAFDRRGSVDASSTVNVSESAGVGKMSADVSDPPVSGGTGTAAGPRMIRDTDRRYQPSAIQERIAASRIDMKKT